MAERMSLLGTVEILTFGLLVSQARMRVALQEVSKPDGAPIHALRSLCDAMCSKHAAILGSCIETIAKAFDAHEEKAEFCWGFGEERPS